MSRYVVLLGLLCAAPAAGQTTVVVGIFAGLPGEEAIRVLTLPVSCGPQVFGDQLGLPRPSEGSLCFADLDPLIEGLAPGTYQVAERKDDGTWADRSLPFTVKAPEPMKPLKTCTDPSTKTTFKFGDGPPVQTMGNSNANQRTAWLARERQLVAAGFDVTLLLNSTSVYFAVTCR